MQYGSKIRLLPVGQQDHALLHRMGQAGAQGGCAGRPQRLAAGGHAPVGIERFRANIVLDGVHAHDEDRVDELVVATAGGEVRLKLVKPCARCPIPNVDPATGDSSPAVLDALQGYRADPRLDGALTFGMNAIVLAGAGQTLRVGDAAQGDWRFD